MVTQTDIRLIAAAFPNSQDAQNAVQALKQQGLAERDISVVYTDAGHAVEAGLLSGAVWGGVLGALLGIFFPPAGLLVAAGPIAGVLASGAAVGAAGALTVGALDGLIAGLIHLGLPKDIATAFGEHIHKGDTVVVVHASSEAQAQSARQILEANHPRAGVGAGGQDVVSVSQAS